MVKTSPPQIGFVAEGDHLYIACQQRATRETSLTGENLVTDLLLEKPAHPFVILDLDGCEWIDSTFAGWMVKVRQRLHEANGRLVISRCPRTCRSSLETMGLTMLFGFEDIAPPENLRQVSCQPGEDVDPETVEFMLHAHEDLAGSSPAAQETFAPIADLLRQELLKKKGEET